MELEKTDYGYIITDGTIGGKATQIKYFKDDNVIDLVLNNPIPGERVAIYRIAQMPGTEYFTMIQIEGIEEDQKLFASTWCSCSDIISKKGDISNDKPIDIAWETFSLCINLYQELYKAQCAYNVYENAKGIVKALGC